MAISSGGGDSDEVLSEINITPMVDVMLVLLVVFIITAPMMTNSIKVSYIWANLSSIEQRRLNKVLPWWNIHRHRIPPSAYANLQQLRAQLRLTITHHHVTAIESIDNGFQLRSGHPQAVDEVLNISADKLVLWSGYAPGFNRVKNIGGKLLAPEYHLPHALVKSDTTFKISATHNIFALGPALSGLLFESTALHETRQQANTISAAVANLLS